jgi:hypothetical protein
MSPFLRHPRQENFTLGLEEMLEHETLKGTNHGTGCEIYNRLHTNKWDSFYCLQGTDDSPLTGSLGNCDCTQKKTGKNTDFSNKFNHFHYRYITFK